MEDSVAMYERAVLPCLYHLYHHLQRHSEQKEIAKQSQLLRNCQLLYVIVTTDLGTSVHET